MQTPDTVTPEAILTSPLFTAREKIELLAQLKAEIASAEESIDPALYPPGAIEEAIAALTAEVEKGTGESFVPQEEH